MPPAKYTREALSAAAAACADLDEAIALLGTRPYGKLRRYLRGRFAHFGIDVSHFTDEPGRPPGLSDTKQLRDAVERALSVAQALRLLGRPDNSRTRARFREAVSRAGIDTSHFLGQGHGKGRPGRTRPPEEVLVRHCGPRRTRTAVLRRALRASGVLPVCEECGTGELWHGNRLTLEIDHVNGDPYDDRGENLRLLCPNCHAVTSTWCRGGRRRPGGPTLPGEAPAQ
ncbi:HNH endonuclease [Streptomyces sp. C10-9-1]|uniref:HNH endonuclease n=1 Tax=Streptomyces sp. C10-9-1 TaxID=1859285 RepID=UPI00211136D8|nr:HNH endonuclease signature motif containing protein [Streptomyces sp. C10-9-1]MCQ6553075.1 HNH endonuclease [Streptomyces sp. C10-9-1]